MTCTVFKISSFVILKKVSDFFSVNIENKICREGVLPNKRKTEAAKNYPYIDNILGLIEHFIKYINSSSLIRF